MIAWLVVTSALVFDLFHTLIDTEHVLPPGHDAAAEIAAVVACERAEVVAFWDEGYEERETTPLDVVDQIDRLARDRGAPLDPEQRLAVDRLLGEPRDRALLAPDPEAVALVAALAGHARLGLLSNAYEREVRAWPRSPLAPHFDAAMFSCRIGVMKPHPVAYAAVLDALGVDPAHATFVGNGASGELAGARKAGFGLVVHANIFDSRNGWVSNEEQRARADTADASADTFAQLAAALRVTP